MKDQTPWDSLGLIPYHVGAGCVIQAGALCMLLFACLFGGHWPIAGFFIGAIPVFIVLSVHYTYERDRFNADFNEKYNEPGNAQGE